MVSTLYAMLAKKYIDDDAETQRKVGTWPYYKRVDLEADQDHSYPYFQRIEYNAFNNDSLLYKI